MAGNAADDTDVKRISPEEAKSLLDSREYTYIDVRTVEEFNDGHVPGAKNIPFLQRDPMRGMAVNSQFTTVTERNFGKNAKLIVGCQKGGRSFKAAETLLAAGFTNVLDMRGGYEGEMDHCGCVVFPGWAPRGFPTSTDSSLEDRYDHLQSSPQTKQ
jgi:rhodanese-related sulfurtransferase